MDFDSDIDGLSDGQEVFGEDRNNTSHGYGATDPLDMDSDNGGVRDGTEVNTDDTNPNDASVSYSCINWYVKFHSCFSARIICKDCASG